AGSHDHVEPAVVDQEIGNRQVVQAALVVDGERGRGGMGKDHAGYHPSGLVQLLSAFDDVGQLLTVRPYADGLVGGLDTGGHRGRGCRGIGRVGRDGFVEVTPHDVRV